MDWRAAWSGVLPKRVMPVKLTGMMSAYTREPARAVAERHRRHCGGLLDALAHDVRSGNHKRKVILTWRGLIWLGRGGARGARRGRVTSLSPEATGFTRNAGTAGLGDGRGPEVVIFPYSEKQVFARRGLDWPAAGPRSKELHRWEMGHYTRMGMSPAFVISPDGGTEARRRVALKWRARRCGARH